MSPERKSPPSGAQKQQSSQSDCDIVIAADMTGAGDISLRVASECRSLSAAGYLVGLVHLPSRRNGPRIAECIQSCVAGGLASVLDPTKALNCPLAVVHVQHGDFDFLTALRNLTADRVLLVADRSPEFEVAPVDAWFAANIGPPTWIPTNRWTRGALMSTADVAVEPEDWSPVADTSWDLLRARKVDEPVTIGHVAGQGGAQWPASRDEFAQVFPGSGAVNVILLGRPPPRLVPEKLPATWRIFDYGEVAVEWLLRQADALAYFPPVGVTSIPDAAIVAMMAAGKPVVLAPRLRPHFGVGPIYCEPAEVQAMLVDVAGDEPARTALRATTRQPIPERFTAKRLVERVEKLVGKRPRARRPVASPSALPRALFVASNGIGLGHVSRLLAVARRLEGRCTPVFATMAQAVAVIESFGFRAEYIPSQMYTGADPIAWDDWLGFEVGRLMSAYRADMLVYDGNELPAGLLRAVMASGRCRLAWIRRAMGAKAPLPPIENARLCDLIIEPGEISAEPLFADMGRQRRGMVSVDPIRLIDDDEALPRAEAAGALGLDPAKPAVLLHLGAGANREVGHIIDAVMSALQAFPEVQVAIAEWANAAGALSMWPQAVVVRGFPLSQYFAAFDFSIGASGYNAFHEVISQELPTIFVANAVPGMDDQAGRARFAQDAGAAFELPEDHLFELPAICQVLLSEGARDHLRQACRRIRRPNGAGAAADALAALMGAA